MDQEKNKNLFLISLNLGIIICVLIYFSSSEVYSPIIASQKKKLPTNENVNLLVNKSIIKRDSYYLSKLIGEKIVQLSGLKYII